MQVYKKKKKRNLCTRENKQNFPLECAQKEKNKKEDNICSVNTILYMQMAAWIYSKVVKVRKRERIADFCDQPR